MRKRKITALALLVLSLVIFNGCNVSEEVQQYIDRNGHSFYYTKVYTPNHTEVEGRVYTTPLTASELKEAKQQADLAYPKAQKLDDSTLNYNCHSYAWYSQNTKTNKVWMNKPEAYWNDYSYGLQVSTKSFKQIPAGVRNDYRAVYFDKDGTVDHSALVTDVLNQTMTSKWGYAGLFVHNVNYCPYAEFDKSINYYYPRPNAPVGPTI